MLISREEWRVLSRKTRARQLVPLFDMLSLAEMLRLLMVKEKEMVARAKMYKEVCVMISL